jgi:type IV pilus assembly protein PilQ
MSRSMSEGQHDRRSGGGWLPLGLAVIGLIGFIVGLGGGRVAVAAETEPTVLQAVDISPLSGNRLQIRFRLSGPPKGPPSSFTINEPARIVLDFLETTNGLAARQQTINVGVADRISVLEGADRTRASLNLARLVPYNVQVQGSVCTADAGECGRGGRQDAGGEPR